jgi:hypothetical protein
MKTRHDPFGCFLICAALCMLAEGCGVSPMKVSGSGSDTEISGTIVDSLGMRCGDAVVKLLPEAYNPAAMPQVDILQSDTTGSEGTYRFVAPTSGAYTISVRSLRDGRRGLIPGVKVGSAPQNIPADTIRMPGSLIVQLPDSVNGQGGYIYLAGTEIFMAITDNSRGIVLDSVPARMMPRLFLRAPGHQRDIMLIDSGRVRIEPGKMAPTGAFAEWKSAGVFHFNTTPDGANMLQNLYNVPVLLRMDRTTINFNETAPQGNDIRFAKPDGTVFPYQIEMWDPIGGHAVVWLKIDTVYANSAFQHIFFYWGNMAALPMSNGAVVFDIAQGFTGDWHLHGSDAAGLVDATVFGNGLHLVNGAGGETQPGHIGRGIKLDAAANQYLDAGRVMLGPAFTVNAWIAPDTSGVAGRCIMARADDSRINRAFALRFDAKGLLDAIVNGTPLGFKAVMPPTGWSQVAARFDGSSLALFVNGALRGTVSCAPIQKADTSALLLGGDALDSTAAFGGMFDEITLAGVARPDEWIQFTYENQKPGSRLIEPGRAQHTP